MNSELQGREYDLPLNLIQHLNVQLGASSDNTEGVNRAKNLIQSGKVNYGQLKRILHDLKSVDKSKDPKTYNLYGGEPMESFGWSVLGQDRDQITNRKEGRKKADEMGGITGERKNSFLKKHSKKPDFLPQLNMVKNNSFKTPISSLGLFEQIERIKNLM